MKKENSSTTLPEKRQVLKRSDEDKIAFKYWQQLTVKDQMLTDMKDAYQLSKLGKKSDAYRFLQQDLTSGILFYKDHSDYSNDDFIFFFDSIKDQIHSLNYTSQVEDIRYFSRNKYKEEIQRYYLKPRIAFLDNKKANQLYGNIHLELYSRNQEIKQLKILVTAYSDVNYSEALSFDHLLASI